MAAGLTGTALGPFTGFNWIYLVDLLVCGILALFFLFYFNRLFATLVSYGIRAWTWHKYRAYVDISALQISLLGGRIFFKGVRYHAHNVTVLVHDGHITWRYWLRLVQGAEIFETEDASLAGKRRTSNMSNGESENRDGSEGKPRSQSVGQAEKSGGKEKELPCRISVKVSAVEAFIYNRSPVYDAMLDAALRKSKPPYSPSTNNEKSEQELTSPSSTPTKKNPEASFGDLAEKTATYNADEPVDVDFNEKPLLPSILRILPIRIECKRAAAVLGNEHTTSIITAKLEKAAGTIDAGHAGVLDIFKLLFNFEFQKVNVAMRPNHDFKQRQLEFAQRILQERENESLNLPKKFNFDFLRISKHRWHSFVRFVKGEKGSGGSLKTSSMHSVVENPPGAFHLDVPGHAHWYGLTRYLDDDKFPTEHDEWADVEYAKSSTLVDCDKISFRFYWDIPGKVQYDTQNETPLESEYGTDINGCKPPEYGLDFGVHGGTLAYGPWADRQRVTLQQIFVPISCVDSVPTKRLKPGETRVSTIFKIFVHVEEDVVLRIPTRESSKDGRWKGRADNNRTATGGESYDGKTHNKHGKRHKQSKRQKGQQHAAGLDARPYAWIDVTIKADTTVNYTMDMFPRLDGFKNFLDLDVKGTEMTSSVNHGLLWRAGALTLEADLSNPNAWNTLRKWPFTIVCDDLELFILRDHMFLITDLVNDWSSGPPPEFFTFVPYLYNLNLTFRNFNMYLNVNDANIINEPADFDRNDFLTLEGDNLHGVLGIPLEHFRPQYSGITFDVLSQNMRMRILSPSRSTLKSWVKEKEVADLSKLTLTGSYSANTEVAPGNTDLLRMDIVGAGLNLKAYGFVVRQFISLKENYFGDYIHFKTLEEFQDASNDINEANKQTVSDQPQSVNELDVVLCIIAENATVMFPTNLYSADEFIKIELPVANLDLRVASYYLDMGLNLSPLSFFSASTGVDEDESPIENASSTQMYVSHVDLNGVRAFGLPPNEPAYVCTWDIDVGPVTGECSSAFIRDLAFAARAFAFTFQDEENAPPLVSPNIFPDATFVRVHTDILRLWFHVGKDALLLSCKPISVDTNDWAGERFSQRVSVVAPSVTLACVDGQSASRRRAREGRRVPVETYAFLQTGASVTVVGRKLHFEEERQKQQAHIRAHDVRTGRAPFLQHRRKDIAAAIDVEDIECSPPAMLYPSFPLPLERSGRATTRPSSVKSLPGMVTGQDLRQKPSISSLASSIRGLVPPTSSAMFRSIRRPDSDRVSDTSGSFKTKDSCTSPLESPTMLSHGALPSDKERVRFGLPASTMAFSSAFSEPYFPLDIVKPDESNVPSFPVTHGGSGSGSDTSSDPGEEIADPELDPDSDHTSVLIKLEPGIRAYIEPRVALTAANFVRKVLPQNPEDVMDVFQINVLTKISNNQQKQHGTNSVLEIQASLPAAHLRVITPATTSDEDADQLDLTISSLEQTVRVRNLPSESGARETLALHTVVGNLKATLIEHSESEIVTPAIKASVDDVLVWAAIGTTKSIHASIRDTNIDASGDQAKYIAFLVSRIIPLVNDITSTFTEVFEIDRKRLLFLIYILTENSDGVGDPSFLSRMTYILRAFPDHYRNQESWKVLSRFRYMLQHLPDHVREDLKVRSRAAAFDCPSDAPAKILSSWTQWRNWDVPNVSSTLAFRMLFNQDEETSMSTAEDKPTMLTVRGEYLRIALSNGPKFSEIIFEDTSLGLDSTPPKAPTGLMLVEDNLRTNTVLQVHTNSILISIDWSVYDVAEIILPLVPKLRGFAKSEAAQDHRSATRVLEDGLARHDFHAVFSNDSASLALQSINLRHNSRAEGFRMALIGTTRLNENYGQCASVLINVDMAATELHGSEGCILQTRLNSPSIYVDHLQPAQGADVPPSATLAGAYVDLEIAIKEQMPGILHLVDSVVLDEVSKIVHLMNLAKTESEHPAPKDFSEPAQVEDLTPIRFSIAMLAGDLHLELSLLQALNYHLEGKAASIRVAPNISDKKTFDIDFDMGQQDHSFANLSGNERHRQDILAMPPINGHISLQLGVDETSISVATTIEKVEVDAAAIQSVMAVMNKPEVQNVFSAIQGGVDDIKHHIEDLNLGQSRLEKQETAVNGRLLFDFRFSLLGIRVAASTPQIRGRSTAEVEFGIGPLHAKASNRATLSDANPLIPQIKAQIQDIGARLWIQDSGKHLPCGNITLGLKLDFDSHMESAGIVSRELRVQSHGLEVNAYPETASTVVDVINQLQDTIRDLDLSKEVEYLRKLKNSRRQTVIRRMKGETSSADDEMAFSAADLLSLKTTVELTEIQVSWLVRTSFAATLDSTDEDAVLTLARVEFATRGGKEARLVIENLMLQLAHRDAVNKGRSLNSALLPEIGFSVAYWSSGKHRSFAVKATGQPLDLRLESRFIIPVSGVQKSVDFAIERFKSSTATWQSTPTSTGAPRAQILDMKHLSSLLVEANFAGAQVYMQGTGRGNETMSTFAAATSQGHGTQHGRYGQFAVEGGPLHTTLKAPGIALKVEYNSNQRQPSINGEMRIDASSNMLLPNVVPLLLEVSNSIKDVVKNQNDSEKPKPEPTPVAERKSSHKYFEEESLMTTNPAAIFGKTKVDLGLRVCRQEFGLSCQPIARVDAKASLDDFYFTMNTIDSAEEYGHFFAMSAVVTKLTAQVKHMYSREPTFSYDMDSIVLSLMNSKHLSGVSGVSAILEFNPTKISVNVKQLQDLLLFREIWLPPEIRDAPKARAAAANPTKPEDYLVQRYQLVAAAAAFPWNATVSIAKLEVDLDLGQSIGRSSFTISNLWASQQKSSSWEQNLCIGLDELAMTSTGRMNGFIQLSGLGVRTSINWPEQLQNERKTPLIQASAGFSRLRAKAAFDYQAFAFGDIEGFDFLMYNVRENQTGAEGRDRLVAVLDCEKAYVFCTSTSPAQAVGLYQAFDRLIQEKQAAFMQSLKDIEKHLRRDSTLVPTRFGPQVSSTQVKVQAGNKSPISLHTDVVLTLGTISVGVFPSTFFDSQILKLEANNIQARFAVGLEKGKIHSGLGMTLGQLQVALASVKRTTAVPKAVEVGVDEVVGSALNAKGGIILRVPKVVASMQTWQAPHANNVDYIFKSLFAGKIDVGWNLSRINFIQGMWTTHSRSLASRLGKALPESAVKITAGPDESKSRDGSQEKDGQEKITAEVHLPQSRYEYRPLEPAIIETPQLRDMGEATPPLEWIGLHRDRLPHVTHQIIIVSLLEIAREVEDAYERILGSS